MLRPLYYVDCQPPFLRAVGSMSALLFLFLCLVPWLHAQSAMYIIYLHGFPKPHRPRTRIYVFANLEFGEGLCHFAV